MKNKTKRTHLLTLGLMALLFVTYSCKKENVIVLEEEKVEKTEQKPSNCTYCCTPHDITGTWYWLSSQLVTGGDFTTYDTSIVIFSEVDSRFEFSEETVKRFNGSDLVYESKYYISCKEALDGFLANILRIEDETIEFKVGFNDDYIMFVENVDTPYIHTYMNPFWTP